MCLYLLVVKIYFNRVKKDWLEICAAITAISGRSSLTLPSAAGNCSPHQGFWPTQRVAASEREQHGPWGDAHGALEAPPLGGVWGYQGAGRSPDRSPPAKAALI